MEITQKEAIAKVTASKKTDISYFPPPHTNQDKNKLKRQIEHALRMGSSIILVRIV